MRERIRRRRMTGSARRFGAAGMLVAAWLGCTLWLGCSFNLDLGSATLFPTGTSFVVSGTADVLSTSDGTCLVWYGENGVTYHLFQDPQVANDEFDLVTTPGVTSRLELATRSDLEVECEVGTVVEVQTILEIVP